MTPCRVEVVLHVHYHELLDEIVDELRSIPVGFDLFVTNSSGQPIMVDAVDCACNQHRRSR